MPEYTTRNIRACICAAYPAAQWRPAGVTEASYWKDKTRLPALSIRIDQPGGIIVVDP
jgi:hypothetical protein